jgi:putative peptidoglycan lipid II flippase
MKSKTVYSIAGASLVLSSLSLMSKGIGFIREIIYAKTFGLSSEYDLFLSSTALIIVINTAFMFLTQHYFIPAYNRLKKDSPETGDEFFNYTFWWSILIGIILAFIFYLFAKPLLFSYMPGVNQTRLNEGVRIISIFLLTIPFNCGISVISAYMQAKFRFVYPAISQIILNIVVIVLVYFFSDKMKIFILPVGFVLANIIAFILLVKPLFNIINLKFVKLLHRGKGTIEFDKIIYLAIIELLSLSYVLVDRYFISRLPEGGLAAMNYAVVIFALPISVISIPLNTTMFSRFSRDHVHSPENMKSDLFTSMKINNIIIIPLGFILYFWGSSILRIFFQRGAFNSNSTYLTFQVLKYYTFGLVFYSEYLIFVKFFYSINKYKTVMWLSIFAFLLKIIFNVIFINKYVQNGLAFSTSLIYIFLFFAGYYLLNRSYIKDNIMIAGSQVLYYLFNGIVSYLFTMLITSCFGVFQDLPALIINLFVFVLIYIFNSYIIGDKEVQIITAPVYTLLKKLRDLVPSFRTI